MTRVGELSRIMFCGDTKQDDLRNSKNRLDRSGLANFIKVIKEINEFDTIEFTVDDIVRSGIVKSFIIAEEKVLEYA
jgi:phosphate starvation-inducible protein PhoH